MDDRERKKHDGAPLSIKVTSAPGGYFKLSRMIVPVLMLSFFVGAAFIFGEVAQLKRDIRSVAASTQVDYETQWFKLGEVDATGELIKRNIVSRKVVQDTLRKMVDEGDTEIELNEPVGVRISTHLNVRSSPKISNNKLPTSLTQGIWVDVVEYRIIDQWVWAKRAAPDG